jgi:hypothetical protein
MATLYARIQHYYLHDSFRFKPKHKKQMGVRLRNLWRTLNPNADPLPFVKSKEDDANYTVTDYPEEFGNIIDQLIRNYHKEQLEYYRNKRRQDAAAPAAPPPTKLPDKKIRARIPIKKIPVWKSR